jgi:hypothetical protein
MARISHTQEKSESSNPTSKYLDWKSMDKKFSHYDKAAGENVSVELPLKFVFLQHYHTVKGWNDASQSGIWSNEVYYIGSEPMTVRAFKGGLIAEGIYKEIKPAITNAGGKYHRSVYVMLEDGSIANLSFKGAVVREWSDFMQTNGSLVDNQWIEINSAKDQKKGSIKYSTPEFTLGANLSKKDEAMADAAAAQLKGHLDQYFNKDQQSAEVMLEADDVEIDF